RRPRTSIAAGQRGCRDGAYRLERQWMAPDVPSKCHGRCPRALAASTGRSELLGLRPLTGEDGQTLRKQNAGAMYAKERRAELRGALNRADAPPSWVWPTDCWPLTRLFNSSVRVF